MVSCEKKPKRSSVAAVAPGGGATERCPWEGKAWGGLMGEAALELVVKAFSDGLWEVREVQAPG